MYEYIPQLSQGQTDLFGANGKMKLLQPKYPRCCPTHTKKATACHHLGFHKDSLPEVRSQVFVTPGLTSWGSKGKAARGAQCLPTYHHQAPGNNLAIATSFSKKLLATLILSVSKKRMSLLSKTVLFISCYFLTFP